jgi:hypothetical protein
MLVKAGGLTATVIEPGPLRSSHRSDWPSKALLQTESSAFRTAAEPTPTAVARNLGTTGFPSRTGCPPFYGSHRIRNEWYSNHLPIARPIFRQFVSCGVRSETHTDVTLRACGLCLHQVHKHQGYSPFGCLGNFGEHGGGARDVNEQVARTWHHRSLPGSRRSSRPISVRGHAFFATDPQGGWSWDSESQ